MREYSLSSLLMELYKTMQSKILFPACFFIKINFYVTFSYICSLDDKISQRNQQFNFYQSKISQERIMKSKFLFSAIVVCSISFACSDDSPEIVVPLTEAYVIGYEPCVGYEYDFEKSTLRKM